MDFKIINVFRRVYGGIKGGIKRRIGVSSKDMVGDSGFQNKFNEFTTMMKEDIHKGPGLHLNG